MLPEPVDWMSHAAGSSDRTMRIVWSTGVRPGSLKMSVASRGAGRAHFLIGAMPLLGSLSVDWPEVLKKQMPTVTTQPDYRDGTVLPMEPSIGGRAST